MSKRSKVKYPNLQRNMNLKRRQELIDFDYIDKLNDTEKEWLNKFMGEYMSASFPKQVVQKGDTEYKRHSTKNLHKKDRTKEVYDQNNARNRDIYAKKTSTGGMEFFDEIALDDLRDKNMYEDINAFEEGFANLDALNKDPQLIKIEIEEYLSSIEKKDEREKELLYFKSKFPELFDD